MAIAWARVWIAAGSLAGFGAVAMAAAAAHALPQRLDPRALHAVESAIQMQGWHALALVLTGFLVATRAGPALLPNLAGAAFLLGLLLFCGSIYAADLAGIHIGPAAPAGGLLLMAGWLLLAASAIAGGRAP